MALTFPYTYISCPCSDASRRAFATNHSSREANIEDELDEEEQTFDPRDPRSTFSLFPPEHLYYCEECHDLKCPRCVVEEIVCWYCPSCLFEQAPSSVKSDGNRCSRNCFLCPICSSQLITASIPPSSSDKKSRYILSCNYCMWSTLDIGIELQDASGIRGQIDKTANGGRLKSKLSSSDKLDPRQSSLSKEYVINENEETRKATEDKEESKEPLDPHMRFNALKSFYKEQIMATDTGQSSSALDAAFSSPSSLSRIMSLYGSGSGLGKQKAKPKSSVMREALTMAEGLHVRTTNFEEEKNGAKFDYHDMASNEQRICQYPSPIGNPSARKVSDLRPMPALLKTKRSRRCAACKHILVKPDLKVTSTRYRIKLIAMNYIPLISLKPVPVSGGLLPAGVDGSPDVVLQPGKPSQWIMTLKNPLFESVSVSLGSPSFTPGKHGHKVTILCPQFSIGKNGDVWDDALKADLTKESIPGGDQIAGKVYQSGRNWTSIVVEIVPATIFRKEGEELDEDENVIEVPIRVRLEWKITDEQTLKASEAGKKTGEDGEIDDGTRELAYWMVLGVGKVAC